MLYLMDENQKPILATDSTSWIEFMQTDRHIGLDVIGPIRISTVFLGLSSTMMLYETMIFTSDETYQSMRYQKRYSNVSDAKKGHEETVLRALTIFQDLGLIVQPRLTEKCSL